MCADGLREPSSWLRVRTQGSGILLHSPTGIHGGFLYRDSRALMKALSVGWVSCVSYRIGFDDRQKSRVPDFQDWSTNA